MNLAEFATKELALAWRKQNGGWVFVPEGTEIAMWFSLSFTPSQIMLHRTTRGMSGQLL